MLQLKECRNELLRAIPAAELDELRPALHPVKFVLEQVVHETDLPIDDVYFMESGLVSLIADTGDSGLVEVGVTGREGFVGTSVMLSPSPNAVHRAIVQLPGSGLRMRAADLRAAVDRLPGLRERCLRYLQFVMVQTAQAAACNARHELPERLARWLLMCRDRVDTDELPMTQEFLSYMLGVRRAGVSVVATDLQAAGLIRQSRGRLTITDRAGLEARACSCYGLIEKSRRRILGDTATNMGSDRFSAGHHGSQVGASDVLAS